MSEGHVPPHDVQIVKWLSNDHAPLPSSADARKTVSKTWRPRYGRSQRGYGLQVMLCNNSSFLLLVALMQPFLNRQCIGYCIFYNTLKAQLARRGALLTAKMSRCCTLPRRSSKRRKSLSNPNLQSAEPSKRYKIASLRHQPTGVWCMASALTVT